MWSVGQKTQFPVKLKWVSAGPKKGGAGIGEQEAERALADRGTELWQGTHTAYHYMLDAASFSQLEGSRYPAPLRQDWELQAPHPITSAGGTPEKHQKRLDSTSEVLHSIT